MAGWRRQQLKKSSSIILLLLIIFFLCLFKTLKVAAFGLHTFVHSTMGKASSSSSSSFNSSRRRNQNYTEDLRNTDLRLGLSISTTQHVGSSTTSREHWQPIQQPYSSQAAEANDYCSDHSSFFVKVYMEGIPIGRKLNLLVHDGYHELVNTLEQMFDTTILWGTEMDGVQSERCHVLTYEDGEGDLIMVGDVPWEMFLSAVKRLKITRVDAFGC